MDPREVIKTYRTRTITRDLTLGLTVIITIILALIGSLNYFVSVRQAESDLSEQATDLVQKLAGVLSVPLWNLDSNAIEQIAVAYQQSENVVALRILDDTGEEMYASSTDERDLIIETRPIDYKEQQIGLVEVALTKQSIRDIRENALFLTFTAVSLIVFAIVIATGTLLQKYLNQPLVNLIQSIDAIAGGDLDRRVEITSHTEIGRLAKTFNSMTAQLQEMIDGLEQEIDARKRAGEALRESEEKFRIISDQALMGIIILHGEMFVYVNARAAEIMEVPAEEIANWSLGEYAKLIHPDDLAFVMEQGRKKQAGEKDAVIRYTWRMITPGSKMKWIEMWSKTIPFAGRTADMVTMIDITKRVQAEEELRESEERLKTIFESAADGILVAEMENRRFCICNPMICQMLGYDAEEILDLSIMDIHPEKDLPYVMDKFTRQARREFTLAKDIPMKRKDGTIVYADVNSFPIILAGKECLVGFFRDITERRRAEDELRKYRYHLEELVAERTAELATINQELEAFSYSVSHDLRAPLRGIDGWSLALLEDYAEQLDERGQKCLNYVRTETQRMGELIDGLLELSRVARADMHCAQVDLSALARSIADRLQQEEPDRQVEFVIQPELTAYGDTRLLDIVLTNLLGNAWKFTSKHPAARIEFGQTEMGGQRVYFVRDNGAGFDMAYARKLFGAFQRMHRSDEFPGSGVGLATVQRIIHRHGGRIWAEAEVEKGATFYFVLQEDTHA